jgi:hypothetical protein
MPGISHSWLPSQFVLLCSQLPNVISFRSACFDQDVPALCSKLSTDVPPSDSAPQRDIDAFSLENALAVFPFIPSPDAPPALPIAGIVSESRPLLEDQLADLDEYLQSHQNLLGKQIDTRYNVAVLKLKAPHLRAHFEAFRAHSRSNEDE